jgi:hypothetical protein
LGAALDQALHEPAAASEASFGASHAAVIALVIIAEQVQQAMERQDTQLGCQRMTGVAGLASGDSRGNHHVTELSALISGE